MTDTTNFPPGPRRLVNCLPRQSGTRGLVLAILLTAGLVACNNEPKPVIFQSSEDVAALAEAAPRVVDLDGLFAEVARHRGKVVLMNFWATYCDPCKEELPEFVKLGHDLEADGLVILGVNIDEETNMAEVVEVMKTANIDFPVVNYQGEVDPLVRKLSEDWGGELPATFIFDRGGNLKIESLGQLSYKEAETLVRKAL